MAASPHGGTAKTDRSPLLAVLAVTPEGGAVDFRAVAVPASKPAEMPEALYLATVAWTGDQIVRFLDRRGRLLRWGWPEAEAAEVADRLNRRDLQRDSRTSCVECRHFRQLKCWNHRRAGLTDGDLARDFAQLLQRCPGFGTAAALTMADQLVAADGEK